MAIVYLVGFMGCGKSAVGAALAEILGVPFVDLDERLEERLGESIAEFFASRGEEAFRCEESLALADVARLERAVVATGGGAFCVEDNRRLVEASGVSVYLEAAWPTLLARLPGEQAERPKFGDPVTARRLFEDREPLYRQARVTVAVDPHSTPDELARRVAAAIREVAGQAWAQPTQSAAVSEPGSDR